MPRKPKTPAGRQAQGIGAIAGQTYGRGVDQEQLQRAMPAPNVQAQQDQMLARASSGAPGGVPVPAAPPMSFDQVLAAAQGQGAGAGLLTQPTARPDEPLTAGLPIGRGPGPEALSLRPPQAPGIRFLERLTEITGDPYFASLARRGRP